MNQIEKIKMEAWVEAQSALFCSQMALISDDKRKASYYYRLANQQWEHLHLQFPNTPSLLSYQLRPFLETALRYFYKKNLIIPE